MARIWLDVYQAKPFGLMAKKKGMATPIPQSSAVNMAARAAAVVGAKLPQVSAAADEAATILNRIVSELDAYHMVDKDDGRRIDVRIQMLNGIEKLARDYLRIVNNPEAAKIHGINKGAGESIDPFVRALAKKAANKAEYLKKLKLFLTSPDTKQKHLNPQQLRHFVVQTQQKTDGGNFGLVPGVRMEKVDFLHRNFEFALNDDGTVNAHNLLDLAFSEWIEEVSKGTTDTPFFLWMEKHPVCTGIGVDDNPLSGNKEHSTQYGKGPVEINILVPNHGCLEALALDDVGDGKAKTFDTHQFGAHSKLPYAGAYVWSKEEVIYCGPHGKLHHSSLNQGSKVRCAGMIQVEAGKVKIVNADSGHYKPSLQALYNFVKDLDFHSVLAHDAAVQIFCSNRLAPKWNSVNAQRFLEKRIVDPAYWERIFTAPPASIGPPPPPPAWHAASSAAAAAAAAVPRPMIGRKP